MATKAELAAQALEKALIKLEMEAGTLREQMKMLGEQVDRSRTTEVPELNRQVGRLEKDINNLRGEFDKAIIRLDKSVDWSRDVWKAIALIIFTSIVSIAASYAKDFAFPKIHHTTPVPVQVPTPDQPANLP